MLDIPLALSEVISDFQRRHGMPHPHELARVCYQAVVRMQAQQAEADKAAALTNTGGGNG